MIEALTKAQYGSLGAKDNKERLRFTIAGIRDGKFYDSVGTDYGTFDKDCEDEEFISASDFKLSRITGAKIQAITAKMNSFFTAYFNEDEPDIAGDNLPEPTSEDEVLEPIKEEAPAESAEDEIDVDAVKDACKQAIKDGKFKKAQKLIDKLGGHKKLQKKLDKAQ